MAVTEHTTPDPISTVFVTALESEIRRLLIFGRKNAKAVTEAAAKNMPAI
jgi:hypothetical protein